MNSFKAKDVSMPTLINSHQSGFTDGSTTVTSLNDSQGDFGIGFECIRFKAGQHHELSTNNEMAWLLMTGQAQCQVGSKQIQVQRDSIFDQSPACLHLPNNTSLQIQHTKDTEWLVFSVNNQKPFKPKLFAPDLVRSEHRGKGQVNDTSLRVVRTIFDNDNSDANAELVLGEVITMPGRWSSYPPHFHPQPEIYHYRFDKAQGYGHAQMGDELFKVRNFDTLKIKPNHDHDQVAAPGYAMYYTWVIRHLKDNRYTVPVFRKEHAWTMKADAKVWQLKEEEQ
jgi:5-deoxy-glucuronate isomerase